MPPLQERETTTMAEGVASTNNCNTAPKNYVLCPQSTEDYRIEIVNEFGYGFVANRDIQKGEGVFSESLEFCFRDVREGDLLLLTNNYDQNGDSGNDSTCKSRPVCIPLNRKVLLETHGLPVLFPHKDSDTVLKERWHLESPGMLMNHSCDPSITHSSFDLREGEGIATRDIAKGEELTCDYATFDYEEDGYTFECRCGASNCRGKRIGFQMLTESEKETKLQECSDVVLARHQHSLGLGRPVVCEDPPILQRAVGTVPRLVVPGPSALEADKVAIRPLDDTTFGLFATQDIPAGRRVYYFWAQPWPTFPDEGSESVLDMVAATPLNDNDLPEGTTIRVDPHQCASRNAETGAFDFSGFDLLTRHSCHPNLVYKYEQEEDEDNWRGAYACRDIQKGDQLFVDFNCCLWERPPETCQCGAEHCRGTVAGFSKLPRDVQEELKGLTWKRQPADPGHKQGQALSPYVRKQLEKAEM